MNFNQQFSPTGLSTIVYFAQLVIFEIGIITVNVRSVIAWPHLNAGLEQLQRIDTMFLNQFNTIVDYKQTWRYGLWSVFLIAASTAGFIALALVLRIGFSHNEDDLNMWVCFLISHTHILAVIVVLAFASFTTQIRTRIRLVNQVKCVYIRSN